jgi:uncharacterized protein
MKEKIAEMMARRPFVAHPALRNGHLQTIAGTLIRRRLARVETNSEPRLFQPAPGVKVLARCSWQQTRSSHPTLVIVHGMEGSTESKYMLGTADKALAAGFNVVRLNMRNCGGTEHLSSTLYHAGLTADLKQIIPELVASEKLNEIYLAGFSLGGNVVLKLAGEWGDTPGALRGVIGISPAVDLAACADAIELRSNTIYSLRFVLSLRARLRRKAEFFPDLYDVSRLRGVWTIRKYDDAYVAPHWGFRDSADYYERESALPLVSRISVPSLIIHAKDDPFIPWASLQDRAVRSNENVTVLAPEEGGHVGFISADEEGEERFWAERIAVDFMSLLTDSRSRNHALPPSVGECV